MMVLKNLVTLKNNNNQKKQTKKKNHQKNQPGKSEEASYNSRRNENLIVWDNKELCRQGLGGNLSPAQVVLQVTTDAAGVVPLM